MRRSHLAAKIGAAAALALLVGLAAPARAGHVFINDVKVDGLKGQKLANVDVEFDADGNVRITARGYKVSVDGDAKAPPTSSGGHHYFIAVQGAHPDAAQWDIGVYVNKVFVKRFRSKDTDDTLFDMTPFLHSGTNVVHFEARKEAGDRVSRSPNDYIELVLGDGEMRKGQVMMNKITAYRRTAEETGSFDSETTLELSTAR